MSAAHQAMRRRSRLRPWPVVERELRATRSSTWITVVSGFVEPVFYLVAMGIGLGAYVGAVQADGRAVPYLSYIAPALLAVSTMNGAVFDSTWNVYFKMHYGNLYRGMLSSSLGPADVAVGQITYALLRGTLYAAGFSAVMVIAGVELTWTSLLCLPIVLLLALAFSSVGMAATTFLDSYHKLEWVGLAVLPMFLFSGTFVPLTVYPAGVQWAVQALPLWHGVELMRSATLGALSGGMLIHVAYLTALSAAGLVIAVKRTDRLFRR